MIAYKYTRYLVVKDGETIVNTADFFQAVSIARENKGTIKTETVKAADSRKRLEKTAYNTAVSDMEIALYNSKADIRRDIKAMTDKELVEYLELEYMTLDEYINQ